MTEQTIVGGVQLGPDGLIHTESIEINAVDGCNLHCRSCSHLSPVLPPKNTADPISLQRDLTLLSRWMRVEHVRLQGGEPLLHPDLIAVVEAIRSSNIAQRIRLVTNGVLLSRARPEVWNGIDEIQVSVYPGHEPSAEDLHSWMSHGMKHRVDIRLRPNDHFREAYTEVPTQNKDLVRRIYRSCMIAHVWRCYNVVDGFFYKCPQAHFLPKVTRSGAEDGIAITDDPTLGERLVEYLNSETPLSSCTHCLGAVGLPFPHEQVRGRRWRELQVRPAEEMLDRDLLAVIEDTSHA
jgi:organic radical activating enzyme